ncbi:acetyl/propionyl/methylcrotonyl-CoA carboxylase subunit alpha [Microbacterium sp.]|jgi:acetyl-CoA/propionyl-CoA carboxylase biotin carboxyl carrier protein|uniref:acetyl/propionyl/methylcrotonyl-CoA carboxylase subunit alpha n=1 Tax=Microbacterium sp. TaxID=51671 RepID=UPI002BA82FA7|nr:biotin carboxylase N-terminal domain-containing protein [Microbacterium sp.]HWL78947.1 biotin carboxylase N-terminal domain-containing protein [Microbacterium sp.]
MTTNPTDSVPERAQRDEGFTTVLVANRGEIARRVLRTLRELGIRSVAVYSDADANAPHVREADIAVRIGPAAASESYLSIDAVIAAARETGAQAIHPGYGFLAENAAFARACADAGIVFIGPGERALEVMGDKIRAKQHVAEYGVPTVPGFSAVDMTDAAIADAARDIGFPLLVKPSAGGGGKGMQVVRSESELPEALATARRVATAAFGDDALLLERLIERPRHIEVQVLADSHGTVVHLGERECTLQRRHQKVIEEAPSPVIDAATRERIGVAACAAAASVDYRGAGTVEFLIAADRPDEFFFIEMNTRLQVEHPVTELVTGIDLVEQQIRIAEGEPIPFEQDEVRLEGHAIEARVYAESPERGFLPSTGDVLLWRAAEGVRTDAAIETGSTVTSDYDPMIAKVIAFGADRAAALDTLDAALAETVVLGVETNTAFLRALIADPAVRDGDLDTGLIDRLPPFEAPAPSARALACAAAFVRGGSTSSRAPDGGASTGRARPTRSRAGGAWRALPGWRVSGERVLPVQRFQLDGGDVVEVADDDAAPTDPADAATARDGSVWVHADGATHRLRPLTRREAMEVRLAQREREAGASDPDLRAPMPGAVVAIHAADGAEVAAGDRIVTIEAMKMEHPLIAGHGGIVRVRTAVGEQVSRDQVLATVTAHPAETADREAPVDQAGAPGASVTPTETAVG